MAFLLRNKKWAKFLLGSGVLGASIGLYGYKHRAQAKTVEKREQLLKERKQDLEVHVPTRSEQLQSLKRKKKFDMLIIGGGATGTGVALDAATRGLNVALVERDDFGCGTSSRSTKLIHGGVRYLEKAFKNLDYGQLKLVLEALHERKTFLYLCPHLTRKLPLITPCFNWWEIPYYWVGLKVYDLLSGSGKLGSAMYISREESLRRFPMLAGDSLKGSVVYYDGQMNDSRVNVSLALTAATKGASVCNHVEVVNLIKKGDKVTGATVKDALTNETWDIKAKVVVNATGPFADSIRKMDEPTTLNIIRPSSGVHIVLPDYYSPEGMGLIVPQTKDGRVAFMLPWEGRTVAGTTDSSVEITANPTPHENEIQFILDSISAYLAVQVRRDDVLSTWSGIRPLAIVVAASNDTASISRDHVVTVSDSGLVTVAGGKWTTYRRMAKDTVDTAIKTGNLTPKNDCVTEQVRLIGSHGWTPSLFCELAQNYFRLKHQRHFFNKANISQDIAIHLSHSYGSRAFLVCDIAQDGFGKRLAHGYPYLEAEVVYAIRYEMAQTVVDVLARRLRLAFLDSKMCHIALKKTVEIMAGQLNWDEARIDSETRNALEILRTMTEGRKDDDTTH